MHSGKFAHKRRNTLSDEQLEELREAFGLFDSDNKGALDARELKAAIRAMGFDVKKEQVRKMMQEIGREPSQLVSQEDFFEIMREKMHEKGSKEEVHRIFQLFDEDRLGKITLKNLKKIAIEIGDPASDEELRELIAEADRDGDGALNFDEFYRVMKRRNNDPMSCWSDSDDD
jgi:Ca2+-binding EF-hand superfamily protein